MRRNQSALLEARVMLVAGFGIAGKADNGRRTLVMGGDVVEPQVHWAVLLQCASFALYNN